MTTLHLNQFIDHDEGMILASLLKEAEEDYKIIIPRRAIRDYDIYSNYSYAAYAGHLLAEQFDDFSCFVPNTQSKEEFFFLVGCEETAVLANILHRIVLGYYPSDDDEYDRGFYEEADRFVFEAHEPSYDCQVMGLVNIALIG